MSLNSKEWKAKIHKIHQDEEKAKAKARREARDAAQR